MINGYYLMPHPPIIIKEIGNGEEKQIQKTIDSCSIIGREISALKPDTIVIISPHGVMFSDVIAVIQEQTVSGDMRQFNAKNISFNYNIDTELTEEIISQSQDIPAFGINKENLSRFSRKIELDHGAMVPLYFVKQFYQDFKIVHITYGYIAELDLYRFGMIVKKAIEKLNRNAVVITSGDLSHKLTTDGPYPYSPFGKQFDETLLINLQNGNILEIFQMDKHMIEEAGECGLRSIYILLGMINSRFRGDLLSYEGPFGVGYGVMKFQLLDNDDYYNILVEKLQVDRKRRIEKSDIYVRLARTSIEYYLKNKMIMKVPDDLPKELIKEKAGVFVSLKKYGNLRGCIGTFLPTSNSIASEIIQNAVEAATLDPRFEPVTLSELLDINVSVDVLSKPEEAIKEELDPKVYGVIVRQGMKRGLLLPDLDGVNTIDEQLEIVCKKAGIKVSSKFSLQRFTVTRHHEGDINE